MKLANRIFSAGFGLIALAEFIGFLGGRTWCLFAAILIGLLSYFFYRESINPS
ncbi:hypothetical protein [Gaoshiqia sediminis]|uniref:Uncharacterized protein n=1 Tax=Gaoshiqia sediminis TaxID=2986998 RepID=A0AA42C6N2_9BACT|nr:hypothetical protein [Gaoshiqia sediminis]MCW0484098.1 hypothetical protein [Gaoshiqia sediminis]